MTAATAAATESSAKAGKHLAKLRERRAEIERQRDERSAELKAAQERQAQAVARGAPASDLEALTAEAVRLAQELAGLDRALPLLDREIEDAAATLRAAEVREAEAEADRLIGEAEAAIEALAGAVNVFLDDLAPLEATARRASEAAARAEVAARRVAGRSGPASRVRRAWDAHPDLRATIEMLKRVTARAGA